MDGEGFAVHVKEGEKVKEGNLIAEVDLKFLAGREINPITPILICGGAEEMEMQTASGHVSAGSNAVIMLTAKEAAPEKKPEPAQEELKKKGFSINFDLLQKLGKVLMTVIAVMPAAGLMLGVGKLVQMAGADIPMILTIGSTMENIGWVIINNLHILFAAAIGGSWAKERAGGAFAAIISFILINCITGAAFGATSAMLNEEGVVVMSLFGQDPLWLAWVTDLINFKDAGDMASYQNLMATVTPACFKVGQMIGATGLLMGIALAMYRRVDEDKKKNYRSMFFSTVLAVFLTGVTEPLEFMFCVLPLYVVYAILQGCAFAMAGIIDLRLHSFGNLEFLTRVPMSLKAGLGADIIHFVICCAAFLKRQQKGSGYYETFNTEYTQSAGSRLRTETFLVSG